MTCANPTIQVPSENPWRYAADLADKHADELGFIPRPRYQPLHEAGRLKLAEHDNDPCGFLLHGPPKKTLIVYQTCIQPDARLLLHGSDLITRLIKEATDQGVHQISLHCAEDLIANLFWAACGFRELPGRVKSKRRKRYQKRWWLELPAGAAHRAALANDPRERTRRKVEDLMALWKPNRDSIRREQRKRQE